MRFVIACRRYETLVFAANRWVAHELPGSWERIDPAHIATTTSGFFQLHPPASPLRAKATYNFLFSLFIYLQLIDFPFFLSFAIGQLILYESRNVKGIPRYGYSPFSRWVKADKLPQLINICPNISGGSIFPKRGASEGWANIAQRAVNIFFVYFQKEKKKKTQPPSTLCWCNLRSSSCFSTLLRSTLHPATSIWLINLVSCCKLFANLFLFIIRF